ncbi:MAG: Mrp/NBP35 family ATP-binding protein [candidate division Zixibacteria bacterium]|nr:Mrp/NBP35 family ATP-binding protein [candidate division Zixibacteria bacterium]
MNTKEKIEEILAGIDDPELHKSLTELNMVEDIKVEGGNAAITIKLIIPAHPMKARIRDEITAKVLELPKIDSVKVEFTAMNDQERAALRKRLPNKEQETPTYDHFKNVIAVCSGKGGVGKSTITTNLAVALARKGHRVGLLDADVYGFSIPRMMGINDQQPTMIDEMLVPIEKDGIRIISMGFFVPGDSAVIWRGPLLHKAISQFIDDVAWGDLDYLLIDLPPGTGDVSISIAQKLPQAKLLIVTTPQVAAYNVAARVGAMAEKTNLEVLGVIENMSYFETESGTREYIFGQGGGKVLADSLHVDLLGEVPLITAIREGADIGNVYAKSDSGALLFDQLAAKIS